MKYCPKCSIMIRGNKVCCPLCQGILYDQQQMKRHSVDIDSFGDDMETLFEDEDGAAGFPVLKKKKMTSLSLLQMGTFLFLTAEILGFSLLFLMGDDVPWLPIVMAGALIAWLDLVVTMYFASNLFKVMTTEAIVAILVSIWADYISGFHKWSIVWMMPICLVVLGGATIVISALRGLKFKEYIIYLLVDTGLALLQIIPIALGLNWFPWAAVMSIAAFLILVSGAFVFRFRDIKDASERVFNV